MRWHHDDHQSKERTALKRAIDCGNNLRGKLMDFWSKWSQVGQSSSYYWKVKPTTTVMGLISPFVAGSRILPTAVPDSGPSRVTNEAKSAASHNNSQRRGRGPAQSIMDVTAPESPSLKGARREWRKSIRMRLRRGEGGRN
jgi:hypothetical protein